MSKPQSQSDSSGEDFEDDAASQEEHWQQSHQQGQENLSSPSLNSGATSSSQPPKSSHPLQKRRRVTRACDECRRKKIKCDGKQPCTHCTVYSYDCTYDQPSNRRRNPAPQYVEALEVKLQRAEAILKSVLPDLDLEDQSLDSQYQTSVQPGIKQEVGAPNVGQLGPWGAPSRQREVEAEKDSMLESMVENTGSLDLDDEGHWDFYGHSSGRAFLRKMRDQFGDLMGKPDGYKAPFIRSRDQSSHSLASPSTSSVSSPMVQRAPTTSELPSKACAVSLCANVLDDACAILRFVHQPTFYAMLDRVYDMRPEDLGPGENKFLPLLYSTLALGTLFATNERSELVSNGFETAIDQGTHWFRLAKSMMDVTDLRDLTSLQTVLMMIMFLQSSSRLSTCYSHIGIVLRSAIRMGLHRSVPNHFRPVEQEVRKRIFWCVRKLDTYVGALLGLPKMLNDEDIDQEYPLEVDDDCITEEKILPMPPDKPSLMAAFNAHTKIVGILAKTVKYVYPIKGKKSKTSQSYIVSHARIREIEQDLQTWFEGLPMAFRPGMEAPKEFIRIQHLLRMAYAHIEMMVYRPFLHYVSSDIQAKNFDKRSYACAAACVSVSRNIVHLTGEMKRQGLLVGSYWFYMYTTFFAVISLVFFVLENPQSETSAAILRDAHEGRDTLAGLAQKSLAADRCSKHLAELFEQLPGKLKGVRQASVSQKRRKVPSPSPVVNQSQLLQSASSVHVPQKAVPLPRRAQTSPTQDSPWTAPTSHYGQQRPIFSDPSYRRPSQDAFSPANPGNALISPDTSKRGSIATSQPFNIPQHSLSGHNVPDLSAMMFPSADPFAYPNQPMTTLENQNYVKREGIGNMTFMNNTPHLSDSPSSTVPPYQNLNGQVYGGIPPYMLPPDHPGGFDMQTASEDPLPMSSADTSMGMQSQGWPQQQGQIRGQEGYDQLFGEDWGGWMNQGYRQ